MTCASNQLDAVAQLLQQNRNQLQSAAAGSSGQQLLQLQKLLPEPEALDELLFLTYLQAQYSSGSWVEGIGLFKQLQQVGRAKTGTSSSTRRACLAGLKL